MTHPSLNLPGTFTARALICCAVLCCSTIRTFATVALDPRFRDEIVLPREKEIVFHGTANNGQKIIAEFVSQKFETVAADGKWSVAFQSVLLAGGPFILKIHSDDVQITRKIFLTDTRIADKNGTYPNPMKILPGFPLGTNPEDTNLRLGLLDITKPPYLADPKGERDATAAIQQAVFDARDYGLACYFPPGTYLISDTISCYMKVRRVDPPGRMSGGVQHYFQARMPLVIIGSVEGERPVIKLSKDARGFDDPNNPKVAFRIWAQTYFDQPGKDEPLWGREKASISFDNHFVGIDIDVRGHPGAVGIRHSGSQGCSLANTRIFAEGAYAGLFNCPGQSAGAFNVEVIGGEYGISVDNDSRFPILLSCAFRDQAKSCVGFRAKSIQVPTMFIGCVFKPKGDAAIDMTVPDSHPGLTVIDSLVDVPKGGVVVMTRKKENLFIENTYLSGARNAYSQGGDLPASGPDQYTLIQELSTTGNGMNLINGTLNTTDVTRTTTSRSAPNEKAILKNHLPAGIPGPGEPGSVCLTSFGAKGDGETDDTEAFKKALASGKKVFIPKGTFRVKGNVKADSGTQIYGIPGGLSVIGSANADDSFVLATPDDIKASFALTYLNIKGTVDWRSGEGISMHVSGARRYSSNSGGRSYAGKFGSGRILEGIRQPMAFYAVNVEGVQHDPQSEIRNCSNLRIYYFKVEAGTLRSINNPCTPCRITNCDNVKVYVMCGNVLNLGARPMLDLVNCSNIQVSQLKAFTRDTFPLISEKWKGDVFEIPATHIVGLFQRQ